jgi:hypothetical protein
MISSRAGPLSSPVPRQRCAGYLEYASEVDGENTFKRSMTLLREEDHLVGFVAAQPVAVTGIGRDVSGPHCRTESTGQKAVLVRGGLDRTSQAVRLHKPRHKLAVDTHWDRRPTTDRRNQRRLMRTAATVILGVMCNCWSSLLIPSPSPPQRDSAPFGTVHVLPAGPAGVSVSPLRVCVVDPGVAEFGQLQDV